MDDIFNIPEPTKEDAASALERVRLKAAVNLEILATQATLKGLDPTASLRSILDAAEFNYKLSGMAKQVEPEKAQSPFSLVINIGGNSTTLSAKVTKSGETLENPPQDSFEHRVTSLADAPLHAAAFESDNSDLMVE